MERLHISPTEILKGQKGKIIYIHKDGRNCSPAFVYSERVKIEFTVPRTLGAVSLTVLFLRGNDGSEYGRFDAPLFDTKGDFDVFKLSFDLRMLPRGLYFCKLLFSTLQGTLGAKNVSGELEFSFSCDISFQLSVSDFKSETLSTYLGGTIYHIFVDRFSKDDNLKPKKGAIIPDDWTVVPEYPEYPGAFLKNNTFYGGTLYSAAKRLDYIRSLGVNLVYLSPVFESPSNHKYDTADYMRVDSMFGGDDALEFFILEAKKRGIGVILDGVFNHTGADSVYFNRYGTYPTVGAFQSKDSPYYNWYNFKNHPNDYEAWWGIEILPRINTGNESFEKFILESVIKKYRKMGICGLRLDVVDELSDSFISKIKAAINDGGEGLLYGEVWEDASNKIAYDKRKSYYLGDELDGVMNYPLRAGIIDYITTFSTKTLKYALTDIIANAPKRIRDMQMNLLGTHDTVRILTALGGVSKDGFTNEQLARCRMTKEQRTRAEASLLSAYTILATLPGLPTIFYGDEAGLEGYSDPFNRMPYPKEISYKILNHYQKIGQIRNNNSVYKNGSFELLYLDEDILAFLRYINDQAYLTVYNNSTHNFNIKFPTESQELIYDEKGKQHVIPSRCARIFRSKKQAIYQLELKEI